MGPSGFEQRLTPVIAFAGVLAITDSDIAGPAFNRASQMFMEGRLDGLSVADTSDRYPLLFASKLMGLLASGTPVLSTRTGHVEKEYGSRENRANGSPTVSGRRFLEKRCK
jgi:hypothetical protein